MILKCRTCISFDSFNMELELLYLGHRSGTGNKLLFNHHFDIWRWDVGCVIYAVIFDID